MGRTVCFASSARCSALQPSSTAMRLPSSTAIRISIKVLMDSAFQTSAPQKGISTPSSFPTASGPSSCRTLCLGPQVRAVLLDQAELLRCDGWVEEQLSDHCVLHSAHVFDVCARHGQAGWRGGPELGEETDLVREP